MVCVTTNRPRHLAYSTWCIQHKCSCLALPVSAVRQRGARRGAPRARGVLEGENGAQKLQHQRPVRAPAAEEEEHAVGAATQQEERQTVQQSRTHLAAETQPVPTLWTTGALRAGEEPHEAPGSAHGRIRWAVVSVCSVDIFYMRKKD